MKIAAFGLVLGTAAAFTPAQDVRMESTSFA